MGDKGKRDKGKREKQKQAKTTNKEKRRLKKAHQRLHSESELWVRKG